MPANSKAGYALFNLDPMLNRTLLKNHRDLWAHESRWDYISSLFPFEDASFAGDADELMYTDGWWDYRHRDAIGDYRPTMLKYSLFARYFVGDRMEGTVLDLGCGPGAYMGRFLYSNRRKVAHYVGVDYREPKPEYKPHFPHTFMRGDVTEWDTYETALSALDGRAPDVIVTLEVLEHMSKEKGVMFLDNIAKVAAPYTTIFLSTPCHDSVHLPHDHVYEWRWEELRDALQERFTIEQNMGTFASQREIKPVLTPDEQLVFDKLEKFYDASLLSCLFAPMHPAESRNSLWRLRVLP